MNEINQERFTLAQAEQMLAVRDCAADGHLPTQVDHSQHITPRAEAFCRCMAYRWIPSRTTVPNWMTDTEKP